MKENVKDRPFKARKIKISKIIKKNVRNIVVKDLVRGKKQREKIKPKATSIKREILQSLNFLDFSRHYWQSNQLKRRMKLHKPLYYNAKISKESEVFGERKNGNKKNKKKNG